MDAILNDGAIIDITHLLPTPSVTNYTEESSDNEKCTLWVKEGEVYTPDISIQIMNSLPSGVYKMIYQNHAWRAVEVPLDTDELYTFSENLSDVILKEVEEFWAKKEVYEQYKLSHKRGILLCGAPGCGKTSIIQLLIKQIIENNGLVFIASERDGFIGLIDTLSTSIKQIEKDRPIITIIEDVDQIISQIGGDAVLLDFLDGSKSIDNHLTILTSNDTTDLSEALLRPSRIDLIYEIPNPNKKIRREYFKKKNISPEILTELVNLTEGFSFAELKETFIGVQVQGKPIVDVVKRLKEPFKSKDYLHKQSKIKGI